MRALLQEVARLKEAQVAERDKHRELQESQQQVQALQPEVARLKAAQVAAEVWGEVRMSRNPDRTP